jgi:glycosyltransferase involved in cell wall biosynthesis
MVVPSYPWSAGVFAGVFNQKCATALRDLGAYVEVLAPRPYSPGWLASLRPKWRAYAEIPRAQHTDGIAVHRPSFLQVPRLASTFWREAGTFAACRRTAADRHTKVGFDAILSFDLLGAGGLAWRLGRYLGVFAAGWATGDDIRVAPTSAAGRALERTLRRLDLVFYQSRELIALGASLLQTDAAELDPRRHRVLSRGIGAAPAEGWAEMRSATRARLGMQPDDVLVLSLGRLDAHKGVFDLLKAVARLAEGRASIRTVLVGSIPGFDGSQTVDQCIENDPALRSRVQMLPACRPDEVWSYFAAADVFAFPSHNEGMPNSVLEAMSMELPVVAFAIPPVEEIDGGADVVVKIPPFDVGAFAGAIERLAQNRNERQSRGRRGRSIVQDRYLVRRNMAAAEEALEEGIRRASRRRVPDSPREDDGRLDVSSPRTRQE